MFSPDGRRILPRLGTARRGSGTPTKALATLKGHTSGVYRAVFSPDGARILTASADNTARLWDADGKPLATLKGHTELAWRAVFSPDGGRILTASWDSTARLWDADGKPLGTLKGHARYAGWGLQRGVFLRQQPHPHRVLGPHGAAVGGVSGPAGADRSRQGRAAPLLTPEQRQALFLAPTPPSWCMQKWPYDAATRAAQAAAARSAPK